ncbi:hypothetical protein D3C87_1929290 [compost metagenome]
MPRGSSVGWFGCRRTAIVPGRPIVLRKRAVTRHLRATAIRSCRRMILETAAAISGVTPGARRASVSPVVSSESSQSRKPPTVRLAMAVKACRSCVSTMRRVTSSAS